MSQKVIEKAHLCNAGTHWNTLGLLDTLLHVESLQLRGVTREDSDLVKFNAVQKKNSRSSYGIPCEVSLLDMYFVQSHSQ
jgi:hypothetical protein